MYGKEYERLKNIVDNELAYRLPEVDAHSSILREAMLYSVKAGGKRLRPVLLLAACELCGGYAQKALPYACAVEFIHTYSLIHDDHPSMDNDDLRRGMPTNHKVFGDDIAILAGDGLLNSAFDVMLGDIIMQGCSSELAAAAYEISLAAGTRGMIAGQTADVVMSSQKGVNDESNREEMLKYIHKNKTGALIRAAVRAGALIAKADENTLKALTEYAENLGLTFQIVDDILDVIGDEKTLGKNTGADEQSGKLTYPSLYGLEESKKKAAEVTRRAVNAISGMGEKKEFLIQLALDLQMRIS
ncbi:MAG: polyprenyl synthetase family protein [Firmicutes bacterium]|nr:polyprenyl synthetase family protein [Bacillota bacterium]